MINIFRYLRSLPALLLILLLNVPVCSAVEYGRIMINIDGIKSEQGGKLVVALFDTEGSWPKHDSVLSLKTIIVSGAAMQTEFDSIKLNSSYAVQVLHDKNSNGKLDFRWFPFPKPTEGVGVSNNNRRLGPPSFEKALFQTDDETTTISIQLDY